MGVRSAEYIVFFDWDGSIVRRIDVVAKEVRWSDNGEYVAIIAENSFYVLKFNRWEFAVAEYSSLLVLMLLGGPNIYKTFVRQVVMAI